MERFFPAGARGERRRATKRADERTRQRHSKGSRKDESGHPNPPKRW